MEKIRTFVILFVVVGLVAPATRADEPIALRYRFQAGQTLDYHIRARQDLAASSQFHPGVSEKVQTDLQVDLAHKVVKVDSASAWVELVPGNVLARVKTGAVRGNMPGVEELPKVRFRLQMDPRGEVTSVQVEGKDSLGAAGRKLADSMRAQLGHAFLHLPDQPVSPGATWQARHQIPLAMAGAPEVQLKVTTDYRYQGQETIAGERCARIVATSKMALKSSDLRMGVPVQTELSGENKLKFVFAIDRGVVKESLGDLDLKVLLTAGKGEQAVKTRLALRLHQEMKLN